MNIHFADTEAIIAEPLQKLLKQVSENDIPFLNIDSSVRVTGPIPGLMLSSDLRKALTEFRELNAETRYLFSDFHRDLEERLKIDDRSYHLIAHRADEILGILRVTPHPFEISELNNELRDDSRDLCNYLEVSRMILNKEGRRSWAGVILCFAVVKWGIQTGYDGLIALCRPSNAGRFGFLGFQSYTNKFYTVPEREFGQYKLLASDWNTFTKRLGMVFGSQLTETFWST